VLTNIPMSDGRDTGAAVLEVKVLTEVGGSDHLPVMATFEFPVVKTGLGLGRPRPIKERSNCVPGIETLLAETSLTLSEPGKKAKARTRVLVARQELTGVSADETRLWIPVTVEIVIGKLVRVKVDKHWLRAGCKREQGVTSQGLRELELGTCPTRYVLGEEVVYYRSRKPGTVVEVHLGEGTPETHRYGILFEGTVQQRLCGMSTLLCDMAKLRPAGRNFDLTSSLRTSKPVFETVATRVWQARGHTGRATQNTRSAIVRVLRTWIKTTPCPQSHTPATSECMVVVPTH
jgi:hypothetical protein